MHLIILAEIGVFASMAHDNIDVSIQHESVQKRTHNEQNELIDVESIK